jgi:hypothetical protein
VTPRAEAFRRALERDREQEPDFSAMRALLGLPGFQGPLAGQFIDGDRFFQLSAPLVYQSARSWPTRPEGARQLFVVETGFVCDLESIPRWAMPFTVSAKCGTLHDWAYTTGAVPRDAADGLYFEALRFQNVPLPRAYARWAGVRAGGWYAWRGYRAREKHYMSHGGVDL